MICRSELKRLQGHRDYPSVSLLAPTHRTAPANRRDRIVVKNLVAEGLGRLHGAFTKREIEVLTLVIEGKSSKEVADMLYVSKRTVDFHLANIYDKLQVSNRVQAFRRAARLGLIPFDPQFASDNQ